MSRERRWGAVWTLLIFTSGLYFLSDNEADNDLWVHLRLGLELLTSGLPRLDTWSYTAAGAPVVDHEWLLHALFAGLYRAAGAPALLLFKLALGLATLGLLATSVARRTSSVHVRGFVLLLATAVLARGFAVRPQIVTAFGVAALWLFLDTPAWRDSRGRWLLVPAFALWANLHGGVVLGVGMAGLCAAWRLLARPRDGVWLGIAVILGAGAAVILNPYGLAYTSFLWRELGAPHPITEWQAVAPEASQATFIALAAAFIAALPFLRRWRDRGWQTVLAGGLLVAALGQQRHTPIFALCAAPLVAEGAGVMLERWILERRFSLSPPAQTLLAAALVVLAAAQLGATVQRLWRDRLHIVFAPEDYPVEAVRRLAESGASMNLAVPLEWGGYAAWHLGPRAKVSLDGRFAMVYPPAVVEKNFAFFAGRDGWQRLVDEYPTDVVLAPRRNLSLLETIGAAGPWRVVFSDDVAQVFARQESKVPEFLPVVPPDRQAGVFP